MHIKYVSLVNYGETLDLNIMTYQSDSIYTQKKNDRKVIYIETTFRKCLFFM